MIIVQNCPDFQKVLQEAESQHQINVVTTRQQKKQNMEEEQTDLLNMVRADYEFHSMEKENTEMENNTARRDLSKALRADSSLKKLFDQTTDPESGDTAEKDL